MLASRSLADDSCSSILHPLYSLWKLVFAIPYTESCELMMAQATLSATSRGAEPRKAWRWKLHALTVAVTWQWLNFLFEKSWWAYILNQPTNSRDHSLCIPSIKTNLSFRQQLIWYGSESDVCSSTRCAEYWVWVSVDVAWQQKQNTHHQMHVVIQSRLRRCRIKYGDDEFDITGWRMYFICFASSNWWAGTTTRLQQQQQQQ